MSADGALPPSHFSPSSQSPETGAFQMAAAVVSTCSVPAPLSQSTFVTPSAATPE